ncbi:MAG: DUF2066 domain-containing protein [Chromatiales bacterium]|jgi:hypothetical protein|nr:DUF2066 domain-containing protein [Chromatiales bacterium]
MLNTQLRQHFLAMLVASLPGLSAVTANAAVSYPGLYEAEVVLEQDTQARRAAAFSEAMGVVLVRLTGRLDAAGSAETRDLRRSAERYVQQFRTTREGNLWVAFDGDTLGDALAELDMPIWGAERPTVLLVLAVDQGGGKRFVLTAEDEVPDPQTVALRERIEELSDLRGVPIVMPLMDAQDRSVISFTEVWGGFDQALLDVGDRYGTDSVLLGRLQTGAADRIRWTLYDQDQSYRWGGTLDAGIHQASDHFAQRYAVTTGAAVQGEIGLRVNGVDSLEAYARVLRYLEGLTAVRSVSLRQLGDESAEFGMSLIGSLENVDRAIRLGGLLQSEGPVMLDPDAAGGERPVMLSYRLIH